jgi:hypothetical protein
MIYLCLPIQIQRAETKRRGSSPGLGLGVTGGGVRYWKLMKATFPMFPEVVERPTRCRRAP